MRDATAADLCKRDLVQFFRYLNGMWLVSILQVLEDLLSAGLFYPNPEAFNSELGRAGIAVDRMKVAMGAVLHKAAQSITDQKFMEIYGDKVKALPEQQQREVVDYWKAGPKPGLIAGTASISGDVAGLGFDKYIDTFVSCVYDMNYNVPADASFYYSPILQLTYADKTKIELNINTDFPTPPYNLTAEAARDAMAKGKVGRGGRIFPDKLGRRTAPRLFRARDEALRLQDEDVALFTTTAVAGVSFILTVPAMPAGMAPEAAMTVKVARRRINGVTQTASVADAIASKLPSGAQVVSKGRGYVVYRSGGQTRIRFDARGAKTLQEANPGRNYSGDSLAGVNKDGEVFVHEGRHRAIGAARGDVITPDNGGVPGQPHILDFEFSAEPAQSGGAYVRNLKIDYNEPDVGAAEADRIWRQRHGM